MKIAITFDDGYLGHYYIARELKKMGVKATFYVITHRKEYMGHELLATRPDLLGEIVDMGHEVGSHTATHPDLTKLSVAKVEEELRISRKFLEDVTGREVMGIAYPWGRYNETVKKYANKYYAYARSTEIVDPYNVQPDLWALGALPIFVLRRAVLLRFLWKNIKRDKNVRPIAYTHMPSVLKLKLVIKILKSLGFEFVTAHELLQDVIKNR